MRALMLAILADVVFLGLVAYRASKHNPTW